MRLKYTFMPFSILLLSLFSSCEDSASEWLNDRVPVVFAPSMDDLSMESLATRVVDKTWYTTDVVGISMTGTGVLDANYKQYKPTVSSNTSVALTPSSSDQTLYYPSNGNNVVTFTAFCPYKSPSSGVVSYTLSSQTTSTDMQSADLIYHSGATGSKSSPVVSDMSFTHKFSKITINVQKESSISDALTNLAMTITGVPVQASCTLSSGAVAVSTSGTINPFHENNTTAGKATAIIAPHTSTGYANRIITFKVGNLNYNYTIPSTFEFKTGTAYTFNFTLTRKEAKFEGATITPWSNGGTETINYFRVSQSLIYIPRAGTLSMPYNFVIETEETNPVTVAYSTSATEANNNAASYFEISEPAEVLSEDEVIMYELPLRMNSLASGTRIAYLHISCKGRTKIVEVIQDDALNFVDIQTEEANCYIVGPRSGGIAIPVSRVNTFWQNYGSAAGGVSAPVLGSSTAFTSEVVWTDTWDGNSNTTISSASTIANVSVYGSGSGGYIIVQPGSMPGNAVVAIRVGGVIKWSWHIWVTDYDPNVFNKYYTNSSSTTTILMDRNLGAKSAIYNSGDAYGLLYQWGRKDPFPGYAASSFRRLNSDGITYTGIIWDYNTASLLTAGQTTAAASIATPLMFYGYAGDWSSTGSSAGSGLRWDTTKNGKAIDDPCPAGWHVPVRTVWTGLTTTNFTWATTGDFTRGKTHDTAGYYPASGLRNSATSLISGSNTFGYYWSATNTTATAAYTLYFSSTAVSVDSGYTRSYGFAVRCAKE